MGNVFSSTVLHEDAREDFISDHIPPTYANCIFEAHSSHGMGTINACEDEISGFLRLESGDHVIESINGTEFGMGSRVPIIYSAPRQFTDEIKTHQIRLPGQTGSENAEAENATVESPGHRLRRDFSAYNG